MESKSILVLGASGMLGHTVLRLFGQSPGYQVWGSARSWHAPARLPENMRGRIVHGIDVENTDSLSKLFASTRPDVVINCVGLVKQLSNANDPLAAIPINSILPHRLARMCEVARARLVHISTDCVFSGSKGQYKETDAADANDLYGRSKFLGEVDYPHAITLRTSIIGHELNSEHGLVGWFLAQQGLVKGFNRAIFSGLPTVELARVIRDFVIPHHELTGTYHVSADSINKFELLRLVADVYGKSVDISPDDNLVMDRSLDSSRFRQATGYVSPSWPELVTQMHGFG